MDTGILNAKTVEKKIFGRQLLICSIASILDILTGLTTSAPTMIIAQLRTEANSTNSTNYITDDMASWASSVSNYAGVIWVILLIAMAHLIGRKKTLMFVSTIAFLALINLYYTKTMTWVIINQALLGINNAAKKSLFIMLISECASLKCRPVFLTFSFASYFWGVWISNALGIYFHWSSIGLFGIACTIYIVVALFFIPESPYWLARNRKYDECVLSHRWFKGINENAEKELATLIATETENKKEPRNKDEAFNTIGLRCLRMLLRPEMYKPIIYCNLLLLITLLSCKVVLVIYAVDILKQITGSEEVAYKWMLILDGITVFGMYLASGLIKLTTRKRLLLLGSSVAITLLFLLSVYLFLVRYTVLSDNVYVTMSILLVYSLSVCCGPMTTSAVMMGELFPVTNTMSVLITAICTKILLGTTLKTSLHIFKLLGNHGAFLFYAVCLTVVLICVHIYVPETMNKTLAEISEHFKSDRLNESEKGQRDILLPKIN